MNPPWESLRHSRADQFLDSERRALIDRIRVAEPGAANLPPLFTRQGKGDYNLYKLFVELAPHLLLPYGRLAALIPAAFASDLGMSQLRRLYLSEMSIKRWTCFENLTQHFPIDSRYKFAVMQAVRDRCGTSDIEIRSFATEADEIEAPHVHLSSSERACLGGPTGMIPEVVSTQELEVVHHILRHGTPLVGLESVFGIVTYRRELDLTLDKKLFTRLDQAERFCASPAGLFAIECRDDQRVGVPLIEGRMISHYDFFAKSWVAGRGRTAEWDYNDRRRLMECRPQFLIDPLKKPDWTRVALCDVTSATNTRTVMASWVPPLWQCGNTAPTLRFESARFALAATAVLNSMTFDWFARRIVSGLHLNKFYLESLVWPTLTQEQIDILADACLGLLLLNPRFVDLDVLVDSPLTDTLREDTREYVGLHATIEKIVALGFRMTPSMLAEVLSEGSADRRGLWRHFASDPHAGTIRSTVTETYQPGCRVLSSLD
jgi:hypothetical protein